MTVDEQAQPGRRGRRFGPLWSVLKIVLPLLIVWFLVIPQFRGAQGALRDAATITAWLLAAGLAAQAISILAHAQLTRSLIPDGSRPHMWTMVRAELTAISVSHVVPGGTAPGAAMLFRLLTTKGVRGADAAFAVAAQGVGSAVVLNAILWLALAFSIPLRGFDPVYTTAAVAGLGLLSAYAAVALTLIHGELRLARAARSVAARLRVVDPSRAEQVVYRLAERLREVALRPKPVTIAAGWATVHRLADVGCMWIFLTAVDVRAPLDAVLVAYGIAYLLAALPITPGGLGVVEVALVLTLGAFGVEGQVLLGVVSYRLAKFWLPIPLGGLSYVSLQGMPDVRGTWNRASASARRLADRVLS